MTIRDTKVTIDQVDEIINQQLGSLQGVAWYNLPPLTRRSILIDIQNRYQKNVLVWGCLEDFVQNYIERVDAFNYGSELMNGARWEAYGEFLRYLNIGPNII